VFSLGQPNIIVVFDIDPTVAAATRNELLTMLAQGRPDRRTAHVRSRTWAACASKEWLPLGASGQMEPCRNSIIASPQNLNGR
jgi:hypothetical protein